MSRIFSSGLVAFVLAATVAACGGGQPPAAVEAPAVASSAPPAASAEAEPLTAVRCEALGAKVVGDIGDGAIHRPDYRCASGKAPLGKVVSESGQPAAIEGAVCCP